MAMIKSEVYDNLTFELLWTLDHLGVIKITSVSGFMYSSGEGHWEVCYE